MEIRLIVNKIVESKPKWLTKDNLGLQCTPDRVLQWENTNRRKFNIGKCGHRVYFIFTVFVLLQLHEWFAKMIAVPPTTERGSAVSSALYLVAVKTIKSLVFPPHAIILNVRSDSNCP